MIVTLDLNPELEARLRAQAASRGLTLEQWILEDLGARLTGPTRLSAEETALLSVISEGFPEAFWARYRDLIARRDAETLTPNEHAELIACSNQIELQNARRVEALIRLAALREVSVESLRDALGLRPVPIAA